MDITMKGYGEIRLTGDGEVLEGEITLYAEGWVAVVPIPPTEDREVRWFPNERVSELVWRKSVAVRRPR